MDVIELNYKKIQRPTFKFKVGDFVEVRYPKGKWIYGKITKCYGYMSIKRTKENCYSVLREDGVNSFAAEEFVNKL